MHTHKGLSKSAEGNLLHTNLDLDARTCILVTDGSVGKQIVLFEVFLWFTQSGKIFWGSVSKALISVISGLPICLNIQTYC